MDGEAARWLRLDTRKASTAGHHLYRQPPSDNRHWMRYNAESYTKRTMDRYGCWGHQIFSQMRQSVHQARLAPLQGEWEWEKPRVFAALITLPVSAAFPVSPGCCSGLYPVRTR